MSSKPRTILLKRRREPAAAIQQDTAVEMDPVNALAAAADLEALAAEGAGGALDDALRAQAATLRERAKGARQ